MIVRVAELQPHDLPVLRDLYLKIRQATFTWLDTSHYQLASFDTDTKDEYTLVAHLDDAVVGFVSAYLPDNFIHHIYVQEVNQNQGIGSVLLKAMLEKLGRPASLKCLQANKAAKAFYKKSGFKQKEKGVSIEGIYILFEYKTK